MIFVYLPPQFIIFRLLLVLMMGGASLSFSWAKFFFFFSQKSQGMASFALSQEPITIDADRLDIFENKHQAVFVGNVQAIQDEARLRCSQMIVSYERTPGGSNPPTSSKTAPKNEPSASSEASLAEGVTITSLECQGPVTITSEDQVVTGNHAAFDKAAQAIKVTGDAKLVKGQNILTGDRILYNLADRVAHVEGHVKALFAPKEKEPSQKPSGK